ncbi:gluconate 2-dehydrogenase subunit 3 family protein [Bradyrhizobium sp. URHD0069]|uniref:gluconate 2-dehydrogenase subunit 3 family protein n=1 Tax=Bradyrhizobium sp. URHD0069 TaxID=1380355 RepID=UPI00049866C3|nr:gluconate 2-dehydrogenase subunit 3 family protein [Bradyrhizobium sp. URHD0069]
MTVTVFEPGSEYVLNHCTKYLARAGAPPPPNDEAAAEAFRAKIAEAWRFPIIGLMRVADAHPELNLVTFVYKTVAGDTGSIQVLGTFGELYRPIPLQPVMFEGEDTGYRAVSVGIPKAQVHTYKYVLDGHYFVDPVNSQRVTLGNGRVWSRFFTDGYLQPLVLEPWEVRILYRLIEQILPFRGKEAENFLKRYYFGLNREQRKADMPKAFRLDDSVGEVNAIDKLLAREEAHRLTDYRLCLRQIDRVLRRQNPFLDPADTPAEEFVELYEKMAKSHGSGDNPIPGWDYGEYGNPAFFLYILRRHAVTCAFSHPKYAGNVGAAGWAFLSERYSDPATGTLFDWRPAIEAPLGTSPYYR